MSTHLSAYEEQRAKNIAENAAKLSSLGLARLVVAERSRHPSKRARSTEPRQPTRELSRRVRKVPVPDFTPRQDEAVEADADEEDARLEDGKWPGERFGEVAGVPVSS